MAETLDVLAVGAHPDDVEIFFGGTIATLVEAGRRVGVLDVTGGEMGTHGSAADRAKEAAQAAEVLGLTMRKTLDLPDGRLEDNRGARTLVLRVIRQWQPRLLVSFTPDITRHPDHGAVGRIVKAAAFLAQVGKLEPDLSPYAPPALLFFNEDHGARPDLIADVSASWERKVAAIRCYRSHAAVWGLETDHDVQQPMFGTFWNKLESRARFLGSQIGANYGEALFVARPLATKDVFSLLVGR